MAIIGINTIVGGGATMPTSTPHIMLDETTESYVAPASEEIYRFGVYNTNNNTAADVEMGLYDITSGTDGATLVASATFTGGASSTWTTFDLVSPVALTDGNRYAVAIRFVDSFAVSRQYATFQQAASSTASTSPLDATWNDDTDATYDYSFYADTQAATGGSSPTDVNFSGSGRGILRGVQRGVG